MNQKNKNYLSVLDKSGYFHPSSFHYIRTNRIPSVTTYLRIDVRRCFEHLVKEFKIASQKIVRYDCHNNVLETSRLQSGWIEFPGSITLALLNMRSEIEIYFDHTSNKSMIKKLESIILEHVRRNDEARMIGIIVADGNGSLDVKEFQINEQKIDIGKYYNDDFKEFDEQLRTKLSSKPGKGIVLLHGDAGLGKTAYLRYLMSEGSIKKRFIYLPPELSSHLASPNFIMLLLRHKGSVLVLEDCENLLLERKAGSYSAMANLLNLSDGLLSDVLCMQVICTFNTQLSKIDPALLRKGRLISRYHFKPLEVDKANSLMKEIGVTCKTDKPMSLANIFNANEKDFGKTKMINEIGFKIRNN